MSILRQINEDTIARLGRAAERRCIEADCLREQKHFSGALYFYGYVVEITLGSAYFRMKGFAANDPILSRELKNALTLARSRSSMEDKAHPIDGWTLLLIEERAQLYGPAFSKKFERILRDRTSLVSSSWTPKLRYRALSLNDGQLSPVREAAHWFLDNSPRL